MAAAKYNAAGLAAIGLHKFEYPRDWKHINDICKHKSGVYGLICNVNGKVYIGSGVDLHDRLRDYHQPWHLESRRNLLIVRAINKYGISSITLVVLEFTNPEQAVASEQVWLDTIKPEYNTALRAGSTLGVLQTDEGKRKISESLRGKPRSQDVRHAMKLRQEGSGNTFFGKVHTDEAKAQLRAAGLTWKVDHNPGYVVTVVDTLSNDKLMTYKSVREAARELRCDRGKLAVRIANGNGRLFRNRYLITIKNDKDKH